MNKHGQENREGLSFVIILFIVTVIVVHVIDLVKTHKNQCIELCQENNYEYYEIEHGNCVCLDDGNKKYFTKEKQKEIIKTKGDNN